MKYLENDSEDQLRSKIEIMTSALNGEIIQSRSLNSGNEFVDCESIPIFRWDWNEYRVKPCIIPRELMAQFNETRDPRLRIGQYYYKCLAALAPELADKLPPESNPFYSDGNIANFFLFLVERFKQYGTNWEFR
jgi:hypothetical protein